MLKPACKTKMYPGIIQPKTPVVGVPNGINQIENTCICAKTYT